MSDLTLRLLPPQLHPQSLAALMIVSNVLGHCCPWTKASPSAWLYDTAPTLLDSSGESLATGLVEISKYMNVYYAFDTHASTSESAKQYAWISFVQHNLGNPLLYHLFFTFGGWNTITLPILSEMTLPARLYMPSKIRDFLQQQLTQCGIKVSCGRQEHEASDFQLSSLLSRPNVKIADMHHYFCWTFEYEKILATTSVSLDKLSRLISDYRPSERPSMFDFVLSAHVLIAINADPRPCPQVIGLPSLLNGRYPGLITHAWTVYRETRLEIFPDYD